MPKLTIDEFTAAYAARSKLTVEQILAHRRPVICLCGEDGCEGWAMRGLDDHDYDRGYFHPVTDEG